MIPILWFDPKRNVKKYLFISSKGYYGYKNLWLLIMYARWVYKMMRGNKYDGFRFYISKIKNGGIR